MLGAVDPVVGFGASTRIKFYSEVAIPRVNPLPYGKIALSGLELDDIARGFFLPLRVGERHTRSVPLAMRAHLREIT